ncbi:phage_rel_nuc, putative phage-type endonuclease [uncultured Caudovirales phage]|uniref:Phage_rel_nuc, putative phage-type endonuclease n=1 Tax=uncultured Caudovirales phage TaxID=2100421 RepID=A0A6J5MQY2_9CAUD|nr:phage_rel_nuc, putative phage-type endonuclease [uncultured Caudovirales phage]CAB4176836.1 phage_rel_nuc, putative phage-type endonuclease [uncultured Caudovirales phage]CAB4190063.1 phage_rel_nuc, putative phage-type endonuclease [uncultured Caudovirales phage]
MSEELIQGTPEWLAARCGKVTASRVADVIAKTKSGWGASRANYMAELIAERLTGSPAASFTNAAMQWGTDHEPEARDAYAFRTDAEIVQVGMVDHPTIPLTSCSPDGLVGDMGLVEIKCPNTATHIDTLLSGTVPAKYITQMMWQMACTRRTWCDFVSYDPRLPESMRLFVKRVEAAPSQIDEIEFQVKFFLEELDAKVSELRALYEMKEAA